MQCASLGDVLAWRDVEERPSVGHERVWGPVSLEDAIAAKCIRGVASVVIRPAIAPCFATAAMRCVPSEVLPRDDDTVDTLVGRLGASAFLDDAHVLNAGNGKRGRTGKRKRLNETAYAAPRRKSWSVLVQPEGVAEDGQPVLSLYNYSAYGRTAADVRCAPMPSPVFSLSVQLWLAAIPFLSEGCRCHPPTHCQLLLYYALFKSAMGRHRDNYTVKHLRTQLAGAESEGTSTHAGMENSQTLGSEVLLYTEGNMPMDFALSFPPSGTLDVGIKQYVKRSIFTAQLGQGTLMVFKDVDDQFFCHEASFNHLKQALTAVGYRVCFAFRWCTSVKRFKKPPHCGFHSAAPFDPLYAEVCKTTN